MVSGTTFTLSTLVDDYNGGVLFTSGPTPASSETKVVYSLVAIGRSLLSDDFTTRTTTSSFVPLAVTIYDIGESSTLNTSRAMALSVCSLRLSSDPTDTLGRWCTFVVSYSLKFVVPTRDPLYGTEMGGTILVTSLFNGPGRVFRAPGAILAPDSSQVCLATLDISTPFVLSILVIVIGTSAVGSFLSVPCSTTIFVVFSTVSVLPYTISKVPFSSERERAAALPCFFTDKGASFVFFSLPFARLDVNLPLWVLDTHSDTTVFIISVYGKIRDALYELRATYSVVTFSSVSNGPAFASDAYTPTSLYIVPSLVV